MKTGENIQIRRDKDPAVSDRITVVFGEDTERAAAIETLPLLAQAQVGAFQYYSLPLGELPRLLALPHFQGAPVDQKVMDLLPPTAIDPGLHLPGGTLYPFQVESIDFLEAHQGRALIADEMGTGKTIQYLGWVFHRPELRPAVVVCPASVKLQWARQAIQWLGLDPDDVSILQGRTGPVPTGQIIICNYDILANRLSDILSVQPKVVAFDECHYLKESKAARSKAARQLAEAASIQSVVGLTGTPILNRPKELWHQAVVINPWIWPNFFAFAMKFCDPEQKTHFAKGSGKAAGDEEPKTKTSWDFSGASNLNELDRRLRAQLMIRRRKVDVLTDLPEYQSITVPFDCDLGEYRKLRNEVRTRLLAIREQLRSERASIRGLPPLDQLEALAERAEANSTLKLYGYMLGEITLLKQEAARAKMGGVKEWLQDFAESGEPLVLFAHHHIIEDELAEHLAEQTKVPVPVLDGRLSLKRRQEVVNRFADQQYPLIICGIKAMGTGVDGLQHGASHLAFIEFGWNPADHDQAASRLHREGQKNAVSAYFLIAAGTIEEDIVRLVDAKSTVVSAAMGGMEDYQILESLVDMVVESD